MASASNRKASHAGSWYCDDADKLSTQLKNWMGQAEQVYSVANAVIVPHAGYVYCGDCAAQSYKQLNTSKVQRIFILGPSHHFYLPNRCSLTMCRNFETPLGSLKVDTKIIQELKETGEFDDLRKKQDEDEHSIEMQLPYIKFVLENFQSKAEIVPVLVGSLDAEHEEKYGKIFYKYLLNPSNLFIISSDFCHWGSRFRYQYYDKSAGEIWQSIENLDKKGMEIIEALDPKEFRAYLDKYQNTICGRHPIGVLLNAVHHIHTHPIKEVTGKKFNFKFLHYSQSEKCLCPEQSSVSYAAGALTLSDVMQS